MIFVDTNAFMYAVGREHQLRAPARDFFVQASRQGLALVTSAEVLQELLHVYSAQGRAETLERALSLVAASTIEVWALEAGDVLLAGRLRGSHPALSARDLVHLAACQRRGVRRVKTWDRGLDQAFPAADALTPTG